MPKFPFTDPERHFLSHWMFDECSTFWGPSIIWFWNNRIDWYHAPQPMAELFQQEEIEAGRLGWFFDRPAVPFEVAWSGADHFWQRAAAALELIPRLQGGHGFEPASRPINVRGRLTPIEKKYLRAYNREMVLAGSGHHITLCEQHGVLAHHLIPFFVLLDDLYRAPATAIVPFPWAGDFPERYEDLIGRPYEFPDHALIPR